MSNLYLFWSHTFFCNSDEDISKTAPNTSEKEDANFHWLSPNESSELVWHEGSLSDLQTQLADATTKQHLCVVVATEHVQSSSITLNDHQRRYIHKTLPFLLEEKLASDIESVHFAYSLVSSNNGQNIYCVNCVSKRLISDIITKLDQFNLTPNDIIHNAQLLPELGVNPQLFIDDQRIIFREAKGSSIAGATSNLSAYLTLLQQAYSFQEDAPIDVYLSKTLEEGSGTDLECIAQSLEDEKQIQWLRNGKTSPDNEYRNRVGNVYFSGNTYEQGRGISLLPEHERKNHLSTLSLLNLKWCAFFFLFSLGLWTGYNYYAGYTFSALAQSTKQKNIEQYKTFFPNDKRVFNVKAQIEGKLRLANGPSNKMQFLPMLAIVSKHWPSSSNNDFSIRDISYSAQRRTLQIDIQSKDVESVENFNRDLNQDVAANILSIIENQQAIDAKIEIRSLPNTSRNGGLN